MALPTSELEWVNWLARCHDGDRPQLVELNKLYDGTAPLTYMHPEILAEVGERIQAVSLGWPQLAVDPLEERLDVLGFRYPEDDDKGDDADPEELASQAGDANLQRVWQDNDCDVESQQAHVDALVMRRSYITVGSNEDDEDTPLVRYESPLELFAEIDPRTRKVRAALRRWTEYADHVTRLPETYATLYLPDATIWYDRGPQGWHETDRDPHGLGAVPVVPLVNRGRLAARYGRSELTPAMLSLSHAGNKVATDMMVAAEFHAIPLRAIFGIGPDDLVDEQGNRVSALQTILGRLLTVAGVTGGDVKPHQFDPTSLANYHASMDQLAKHATALAGLPPSAFGVGQDQPASAEAWRAAEARLVKRAERRQLAFGGAHEAAMRLVCRFQSGDWDPKAKRLETIWRDASTPTRAQAADAAAKLLAAGAISRRQAREDMGYTPSQIRRMDAEDKVAAEQDPVMALARGQAAPPGPVDDPAGPPPTRE